MKTIRLHCIDSTNKWAKEHVSSFDPDIITCIVAEEQTAGKGRCERSWVSPPKKNIYATFYFRLPKSTLHLGCLAHLLCLSLVTILIQENLQPKIKWPNDILLSNKKLAGVLCETSFQNETIDIFLGIGINVNMEESQLKKIDKPATSLFEETKTEWDREDLLKKLQSQFAQDLEKFKKEGFVPFHAEFENLLAYKGEEITCFDGKSKFKGIVHSISCDGELNLYLPQTKEMKSFLTGDICFVS